jgi:hypothetical protein
MDITKLTLSELKVLFYDVFKTLEQSQVNLKAITEQIAIKEKENIVFPSDEEEHS